MYLDNRLEPTGYEAFKLTQLATLMQRSAASNILLYDIKQTLSANGIDNEYTCGSFAFPTAFAYSLFNSPHGFSNKDSKDLPDLGKDWAVFLADNFSGFGLDYCPKTVSLAKAYISNKYLELPSHIVIGTTSKAPEIVPELNRRIIPTDLYQLTNLPDDNPPTPDRKKRGLGKP
ncbi:hypothetical protein [Providencia sp. PROV255]|uniref:hypothetical protein n=1 Tax=Providencia sp. PROV255 TaxID=2949943 RepID=UPI00234C0079|nr:hypothetical protein [Providencia sp. PROV255]